MVMVGVDGNACGNVKCSGVKCRVKVWMDDGVLEEGEGRIMGPRRRGAWRSVAWGGAVGNVRGTMPGGPLGLLIRCPSRQSRCT